MKISAVIPAYNSAAFIGQALDSIAAQHLAVHEIVVVDDGSIDGTRDVVRQWQGSVPVRLESQPNLGPSTARNRGIELASGDWIAFLDADDQWTPNKIEDQIAAIRAAPELALVASDMAEVDDQGKVTVPSMLAHHGLLDTFEDLNGRPIPDALAFLVRKNFIPTGTVLARREVLMKVGLFNADIRYGEDLELWARIAARHPITCLPKVHMLRRRHEDNATGNEIAMLLDLIEVNRNIVDNAENVLIEQGIRPNELIAGSQWMAGYWYFSHGDFKAARRLFLHSLKKRPTLRSLLHLALSTLPAPLVDRLRHLKQESLS